MAPGAAGDDKSKEEEKKVKTFTKKQELFFMSFDEHDLMIVPFSEQEVKSKQL